MTRGANAYPAARMSPKERRLELCRLLCAGLLRLRARQRGEAETVSEFCDIATTHPLRTER